MIHQTLRQVVITRASREMRATNKGATPGKEWIGEVFKMPQGLHSSGKIQQRDRRDAAVPPEEIETSHGNK